MEATTNSKMIIMSLKMDLAIKIIRIMITITIITRSIIINKGITISKRIQTITTISKQKNTLTIRETTITTLISNISNRMFQVTSQNNKKDIRNLRITTFIIF